MIYGIGTDIAAVARLRALWERHGDKAVGKILAQQEMADFARAVDKGRFLAKRFAAKEALAKALGTGLRAPVLLPAIRVVHDALGKPAFDFEPALAEWIRQRSLQIHLSISDEVDHALAFVVVETL